MLAAVVAGLLPDLVPSVERAAAHFRDNASYVGAVLNGRAAAYRPVVEAHVAASAWIYSGAAALGAVVLAAIGLSGRHVLPVLGDPLRAAHSGHIGDYIAWWTFGMTLFGALVLWAVAG
jgi:multicomponent Na+:H+ antiporter subunit D